VARIREVLCAPPRLKRGSPRVRRAPPPPAPHSLRDLHRVIGDLGDLRPSCRWRAPLPGRRGDEPSRTDQGRRPARLHRGVSQRRGGRAAWDGLRRRGWWWWCYGAGRRGRGCARRAPAAGRG